MSSTEPEHLEISPEALKFRFEIKKNIPVTLSLHNPGQDRLAFKVKTTSPKKYCVRPSSGYVEPGATKDVQVIMQAQREYPPNLADCKDKFLVQSVKVGPDAPAEVSPDLFDTTKSKEGTIKQTKLRVLLLGPPKPPSPVPEGVEEEGATPGRNAFKENGAPEKPAGAPTTTASSVLQPAAQGEKPAVTPSGGGEPPAAALSREREKHREQLGKVEADKADLKKRISHLELQMEGRPTGTITGKGLTAGGFTLIHLIIMALVAFLIGYFLH